MVRVLTVDSHGFLYLVPRGEWLAKDPVQPTQVTRPFFGVSLCLTRTRDCGTRTECVDLLRDIQLQHMREGCSDIRHNFLIGGYGTVYEGRGWLNRPEDSQYNNGNLDIAFIGNFATNSNILRPPPYEMFASALTLVKYGLKNEFIKHDFKMSYYFHLKDAPI